jgi:hypothetical protein
MKITSLLGGDETSGYTWQLVTAIYNEVDGLTLLVSQLDFSAKHKFARLEYGISIEDQSMNDQWY